MGYAVSPLVICPTVEEKGEGPVGTWSVLLSSSEGVREGVEGGQDH